MIKASTTIPCKVMMIRLMVVPLLGILGFVPPGRLISSRSVGLVVPVGQPRAVPTSPPSSSSSSSSSSRIVQRRMFTGIVEEMGTVISLEHREDMELWDGSKGTGTELTVQGDVVLEGAYLG